MSRSKKHFYFFGFISLLIGLIISGCASSQVTNNSGSLLNKVRVGCVNFSENLDYCGDGCSTGFKRVLRENNKISLRATAVSPWITIGNLGPFVKNKNYSVNIRKVQRKFCAELWKRNQTNSTFNNDTTKELIQSRCPEGSTQPNGGPSPITQVTNNSGSLLYRVKVGDVEFSENLDYCGTGCSTGFDVVAAGDNQIALKETSSSGWQTMNELLGPFQNGLMYSVNIMKNNSGNFCAELWKRDQANSEFNDDTTRDLIDSHCFE